MYIFRIQVLNTTCPCEPETDTVLIPGSDFAVVTQDPRVNVPGEGCAPVSHGSRYPRPRGCADAQRWGRSTSSGLRIWLLSRVTFYFGFIFNKCFGKIVFASIIKKLPSLKDPIPYSQQINVTVKVLPEHSLNEYNKDKPWICTTKIMKNLNKVKER